MTGIVIVIISVVAAAYLIVKKYYAPGALLFVGLITLAVVALIKSYSFRRLRRHPDHD